MPHLVGDAAAHDIVEEAVPVRRHRDQITGLAFRGSADLARRIAENPGNALRMTKRLLREGQVNTLDSVLNTSAALQVVAHKSAEHREAVLAFIEKRKPVFPG